MLLVLNLVLNLADSTNRKDIRVKFNMTFLKLLLCSSIIYITKMAIASSMHDEKSKIKGIKINDESKIMRSALNDKSSNISDYILPIHYNMKLMLFDNYLVSECIITLNISYTKRYLSFYVSDSTQIIASKLILIKNKSMIYKARATNRDKNNIVVLDFGDVLLHGMYDLYIEFKIPINIVRESFGIPYINKNGEKEWLIGTGIQRRNKYQAKIEQIFPYWDKPELRITFVISIMHYPKYKALSNMPIRETKLDDNIYKMWTYFHETNLISIDSVAFLVSGFHQINISRGHISQDIWFRPKSEPHLKFAKTVISSANVYMRKWNIWRKALEQTFVSFENKVDYVVIPDLQDGIKETFGFIFYREADITYNVGLDSVAHKTIIARLIARGMVQKYIRNLFKSTHLWSHTWLNEGFNMYYQTYIIDKALPNSRMMDLFVVQVQHELLYLNTYVVINSTIVYKSYYENYLHSSLTHIKGSIIWRMLVETLPPSIFVKGLDEYMNNQFNEPEATTSDHLWNTLKSKMIELDPKYDFNIKDTIDSWIMQRYPSVLEVTRNYSANDSSSSVVTVSVELHILDQKQYYIPVTYTTKSKLDFSNTTFTNIWLTPLHSKLQLSIEKNEWIIFNIQQAGYYRVNYDTANWRKIAQYLHSEKYSNIHVLNRAQIINDAFHFAIEKKLEFSVFWELASYLAQEEDYIAWYPMFKAVEFLSNIFPFLDFYPEFKGVLKVDFMRNFRFSNWNLYDENNDHIKCLQQELAKWECIISDHLCEKESTRYLKWHLANPKTNTLLPGWKRWTYCNGLKTADRDTWNKVLNNYMKGNDTNDIILECLAYSKYSEIIINYLEIIDIKLLEVKILKIVFDRKLSHHQLGLAEKDHALYANIFLSVIERHTKYMLTNLLNNYRLIKHGLGNDIVTLTVIINNAYSKRQLKEIKEFVKKKVKRSIISNSISPFVEYKIETRKSEIEKQIKHFRALFNN